MMKLSTHPALLTHARGAKRDLEIARQSFAAALQEKRPAWGAALATDRAQFVAFAKRVRGQGRFAGPRRRLVHRADQALLNGRAALYRNVYDAKARSAIANALLDLAAVSICEAAWRDIRSARWFGLGAAFSSSRGAGAAYVSSAERVAAVRLIAHLLIDGIPRAASFRAAELRTAARNAEARKGEDANSALFVALSLCGEAAEVGGDTRLASAAYVYAAVHGLGALVEARQAGDETLSHRLDGLWKLFMRLGRLALDASNDPTLSRRRYASCVAAIERAIDLAPDDEPAQANLPAALLGLATAAARCQDQDDAEALLANAVRMAEDFARARPGDALAHIRLMEAYAARDAVSPDEVSVRRAIAIGRLLARSRRLPKEAEALLETLEKRSETRDRPKARAETDTPSEAKTSPEIDPEIIAALTGLAAKDAASGDATTRGDGEKAPEKKRAAMTAALAPASRKEAAAPQKQEPPKVVRPNAAAAEAQAALRARILGRSPSNA